MISYNMVYIVADRTTGSHCTQEFVYTEQGTFNFKAQLIPPIRRISWAKFLLLQDYEVRFSSLLCIPASSVCQSFEPQLEHTIS